MNQEQFKSLYKRHEKEFKQVNQYDPVMCIRNEQLNDIDFGYEYYKFITIDNCVLRNCNLNDTSFSNCQLTNNIFHDCDLTYALFRNCNLSRTDLSHNDLTYTNFLAGTNIDNLNLLGCKFTDICKILEDTKGLPIFVDKNSHL